jgi:molybdate transport system substrate-binding protein
MLCFILRRWLFAENKLNMVKPHLRLLLAGLSLMFGVSVQAARPITVAAASDLQFALKEIATEFEAKSGQPLRLVFGSSGNFYAQILQGAPFHLFMSADEVFVFKLADAGFTRDRGRLYAMGRIGIQTPKGSAVRADSELKDLAAAMTDGRLKKFAIANPEHAPYGMRAEEALRHAGLWDRIRPMLVYGENISQAMQFALSGSAQGGIIAYSLALAPQIKSQGEFALIPQSWHQPLAQRMVVLKNAPPAAQVFYDYLSTPDAQKIMQRYGFEMPRP